MLDIEPASCMRSLYLVLRSVFQSISHGLLTAADGPALFSYILLPCLARCLLVYRVC